MNWVRENKFLSGFIAVMVIGVGALGFLLYTSWSNYSEVTDTFNEQASALHTLQSRIPYPDDNNLAKYKAEENDYIDATHDLAATLSGMVLPVKDLTPAGFQDELRQTVSDVTADAAKAGVKLPDKFYMDFDKYETSPPPAEVAGAMGRQLAALKLAVEIVINEHVDSIDGLQRTPFPQEAGTPANGGGGHGGGFGGGGFGGGGFGGGGRRGGGEGGLVEKFPFDLRFTASQPVFQKVLNDFAASTTQFFITRALLVENTNPKPTVKGAATPTPTPATTGTDSSGTPDTSGTNSAPSISYIVGEEKLNVDMRVDIVAFHPPASAVRPGAQSR